MFVVNLLVWIINIIKSFMFFVVKHRVIQKRPLTAFKVLLPLNDKTHQKRNYILCHLLIASH